MSDSEDSMQVFRDKNDSDTSFKISPKASTSTSKKLRIDRIVSSESEEELSNSDCDESERCAICLGRIKGKIGSPDAVGCDHYFCLLCILEWAKNNASCPQDRRHFNKIFVRKYIGGSVTEKVSVEVKKTDQLFGIVEENPTYCEVCGSCEREDCLLLCDGCDLGYHLECLTPPLSEVPIEEWFCPMCVAADFPQLITHIADREADAKSIAEKEQNKRVTEEIRRRTVTNRSGMRRIPRTRETERILQRITRERRKEKKRKRKKKKHSRSKNNDKDKDASKGSLVHLSSKARPYGNIGDDDIDATFNDDDYADNLLNQTLECKTNNLTAAEIFNNHMSVPSSTYVGRDSHPKMKESNIHAMPDILNNILAKQNVLLSKSSNIIIDASGSLTSKEPPKTIDLSSIEQQSNIVSIPLPSRRKVTEAIEEAPRRLARKRSSSNQRRSKSPQNTDRNYHRSHSNKYVTGTPSKRKDDKYYRSSFRHRSRSKDHLRDRSSYHRGHSFREARKHRSRSQDRKRPRYRSSRSRSKDRGKIRSPRRRTPRSRSPRRRTSRSRSPKRRTSRSRSPKRRTSRSPKKRTSRSRSPKRRTSRSKSPKRRHSRSKSPRKRTSGSRSPKRCNSRSKSPTVNSRYSKSPKRIRSRSKSPKVNSRYSKSPKRFRSRSKSPPKIVDLCKSPEVGFSRSISPERRDSNSSSPISHKPKYINSMQPQIRSSKSPESINNNSNDESRQVSQRKRLTLRSPSPIEKKSRTKSMWSNSYYSETFTTNYSNDDSQCSVHSMEIPRTPLPNDSFPIKFHDDDYSFTAKEASPETPTLFKNTFIENGASSCSSDVDKKPSNIKLLTDAFIDETASAVSPNKIEKALNEYVLTNKFCDLFGDDKIDDGKDSPYDPSNVGFDSPVSPQSPPSPYDSSKAGNDSPYDPAQAGLDSPEPIVKSKSEVGESPYDPATAGQDSPYDPASPGVESSPYDPDQTFDDDSPIDSLSPADSNSPLFDPCTSPNVDSEVLSKNSDLNDSSNFVSSIDDDDDITKRLFDNKDVLSALLINNQKPDPDQQVNESNKKRKEVKRFPLEDSSLFVDIFESPVKMSNLDSEEIIRNKLKKIDENINKDTTSTNQLFYDRLFNSTKFISPVSALTTQSFNDIKKKETKKEEVSIKIKEIKNTDVTTTIVKKTQLNFDDIGLKRQTKAEHNKKASVVVTADDSKVSLTKTEKIELEAKVVKEANKYLYPYYQDKCFTKQTYKEIMEKIVRKVLERERSMSIKPDKIQRLVDGYVQLHLHKLKKKNKT